MSNKFTPAFKQLINITSRKCFGFLPIPTVPVRTGMRLLRQKPLGPLMMNHYLPDMARPIRNLVPGFLTEQEERRQDALVRLRRRGKAPPKKGQGKRASKKK